jgi:twitching motility protein PilT
MSAEILSTDMQNLFESWLRDCVARGASDLHLAAGQPPAFRIHGELRSEGEALAGEVLRAITHAILNDTRRTHLQEARGADLGYALPDGVRFRVNVYYERGEIAYAIRRLENSMQSLESLRLPQELHALARYPDGLVLVTGPTGSGKSTTLAALIDEINRTRRCHILTIEDPIEYVHSSRKSVVHQRQLYDDVPSFSEAVRASLREDPDVILVGEMRDLATMRAAVTAAETGHLVFSTLHTGDAVGAIDRIIGSFPAEEQQSIRQQMSLVLRAVVTQHLLPTPSGKGRVPLVEILMVTQAVASLIRQNKPRQIYSMMEAGAQQGMVTLETALARLVRDGLIDEGRARLMARDETQFERLLKLMAAGGVA